MLLFPWLIVLCCFLVDACSLGGRSLFLVVIILFEKELNWSISNLSLVMAIVHICNGISTPLSGYLVDKFPHDIVIGFGIIYLGFCYLFISLMTEKWHVYFIYGVLCGLAFGLLNLNVFSVAVMKHMPIHRRGIAIGIAASGSTFGQFALVPLFTLASNIYGWRVSFQMLSIFTLSLTIPSVILLRYSNNINTVIETDEKHEINIHDNEHTTDNTTATTATTAATTATTAAMTTMTTTNTTNITLEEIDKEIDLRKELISLMRLPRYWGLALSFFICGITTTGFIESHFVAFGVNIGIVMIEAALAFSVLSAFNGIAVLIAGWLSDFIDRYILLSIIFGGRAFTYILLLFGFDANLSYTTKLVRLYIFAAFFGICDYSVVPPTVSLIKSLSPNCVGIGVGILLLIHSIGASIGSYIGGILFEEQETYTNAVIICLVVCITASIICFVIRETKLNDVDISKDEIVCVDKK